MLNVNRESNALYFTATGSTGTIGGKKSHEFHILSEVGEDRILHCDTCKEAFNDELCEVIHDRKVSATDGRSSNTASTSSPKCIHCGSSDLSGSTSIEVCTTL